MFRCCAGATYLLNGHLWVVICDPCEQSEEVIVTFLTSQKEYSDTTVVLSSSDHRFIKQPTVVSYPDSKIREVEFILRRVDERDYEPREEFEPEILARIQQGLLLSPHTPRYIKQFFRELSK